jgi:ubiquinone/menaquinone biosynthesis C-methylase UbiE
MPRRWSLVPERRDEPELMDAPGLPPGEVEDAYRVLRSVNRQFFGSGRSLRLELDRWILDVSAPKVTDRLSLLDVGSGSGDLPRLAAQIFSARGVTCRPVSLDRDQTALALASRAGLSVVRADALTLPFPDQSFDIVTAAKFAHHFSGSRLARLLSEMARVARRRVLVLDIRRHWLAYVGFAAWSRVFTRNRLVRYDGPLSVLRGFTEDELLEVVRPLSRFCWTTRRHAGFQIALVGTRRTGGRC